MTPSLPRSSSQPGQPGFTLIEISMVIGLMLALTALAGLSVSAIQEWKLGKNASLSLQAVYAAQRSYLADHPATTMSSLPASALVPYLPEGWTAMPVVTSLDGAALTVDHTVMPPVLKMGTARYDPSKTTSDGLWDVGG